MHIRFFAFCTFRTPHPTSRIAYVAFCIILCTNRTLRQFLPFGVYVNKKSLFGTLAKQTFISRIGILQRQITHCSLHEVVIAIRQRHINLGIGWQVAHAVLQNKVAILTQRSKIGIRSK